MTQPQRLLSLMIDAAVVGVACFLLFGTVYPPIGNKGFWAYSALLAVLVGSKLVTPYYVKPVDAISYAVPAFVSLMLINRWSIWTPNQKWWFGIAAGFSASVVLLAIANIVANSVKHDRAQDLSNQLRLALEIIGRPGFVYTPLLLFAVFAFHQDRWLEAVVILIVAGLIVLSSVGDSLIRLFLNLKSAFAEKHALNVAGTVVAFQEPGLVLLRQNFEGDINKHDILYVEDRHGPKKLVLAVDFTGRLEGILVRTVELGTLTATDLALIGNAQYGESAYHLLPETLEQVCHANQIDVQLQKNMVGLVTQDSSVDRLYFEVVENSNIEVGRLVSTVAGEKRILYQVVAGLTKEEVVLQKNTFGYIRGQAQQVGIWNDTSMHFTSYGWLPQMNTPVYLESITQFESRPDAIGHFPQTNYHASIKSISDLVTHNTAILGILGVGKSMLAIELVERMIADRIKVVCLDLTNQYGKELSDFYEPAREASCLETLREAAERDRTAFADNPEEGGSLPHLRKAFFDDLKDFLSETNPSMLKIYNPSSFAATKQLAEAKMHTTGEVDRSGKPVWERGAALWSVTPVEITQIISETVLELLSDQMSEKARACLVYEEAHSLVPEWNSVVNDGDKHATSGTARAILQGRKYGVGCVLVTQRTANVTKTILNQCNTVFAMRSFDDRGKEFLSNYIGSEYADALSTIPERHAVFFGKASSCENPILIRLNDRAEFLRSFRGEHPPPKLPEYREADRNSKPEPPVDRSDFDDDIPF